MDRLICILTPTRAGSSLVAGIFRAHGVWTGETGGSTAAHAYGDVENKHKKNFLRHFYGRYDWMGFSAQYQPDFKGQFIKWMEKHDPLWPPDGPWMVKANARTRDSWRDFDPIYIGVIRPFEAVKKSNRRLRPSTPVDSIRKMYVECMEEINRGCDAYVYTDDLIEGNLSSAKEAVEACGLEWNEDAVRKWIDPEQWHFKGPV